MAILRAQRPDGTYGDVKMDAKGRLLVDDGVRSPIAILDYPPVGVLDVHAPQTDELHIFYKGAGESGRILSLWMNVPAALEPTAELRIYVDAGDIPDPANPPSEHLAARIPLRTLLGLHWNTFDAMARDTAILACVQHSMSTGWPVFELTLPIPYSNGCAIQIWQNNMPRPVALGDVYRMDFEEGPLPQWPYSDWRLRSGSFDGVVAYGAMVPEAPGSCADFLTVQGRPGMLVGLYAAMKSLAAQPSWDYCQNGWELSIDNGERYWRTMRTEDMFGGSGRDFQLGLAGSCLGYTWGLMSASSESAQWEAYRLFTKAPFVWSQACAGTWRNSLASTSGDIEAHILTLYYSP